MGNKRILFLTGWRGLPGGAKPTFLALHGHDVVEPRQSDDDFEEAVRFAQAEFDRTRPDVVVGLSRGGAVAMSLTIVEAPLVLMCPGWKRWGTARTVKCSTIILHSRSDEIVPFAHSEELLRVSGLPHSALLEVGNDHWLNDQESLTMLLQACEGTLPGR